MDKLNLEKYFFEIIEQNLEYYNSIEAHRYKTIGKKENKKFLGIKKTWHTVLTNEEIYHATKHMICSFTNDNDFQTLWAMSNPEENWFTSMLASVSVNEYLNRLLSKKSSIQPQLFITGFDKFIASALQFDKKFPSFTKTDWEAFMSEKLSNLQIGFICFNGYDIDYAPQYYLTLFRKGLSLKVLPISRQSQGLKPFNKLHTFIEACNTDSIEFCPLCDTFIPKFKFDLHSFICEYFKRYLTPIKHTNFCPVIMDIFDINLKPSSISSDDKLKKKITGFKNMVDGFLTRNKVDNYSSVNDFIIENRILLSEYFDTANWKKVEETITLNQAYQRSVSRLKKVLVSEKDRDSYEAGCIVAFDNIKNLI